MAKKYLTKDQQFERDVILLGVIKEHKGCENAITSAEIMKYLAERGYYISHNSQLRRMIRKVMYEFHAPICHKTDVGYFWAKSREDILMSISDLEGRIAALQEHIAFLKDFIVN